MATVAPWGRVTESPDEMTFSGSFAPIFVLGALCVAIALAGCIVYGFYQSTLLQTFSDSLRISPSVLQIIAVSLLAFFLLLGILLMFLNSKTTLVMSKSRSQIFLQTRRWLGRTRIVETYDISDVLRVELRNETKMEKVPQMGPPSYIGAVIATLASKPVPVLYQRSIIVFKDGRELLLGRMRTLAAEANIYGTGPRILDTIGTPLVASQVASFLGVSFAETNGNSVSPSLPD